jgi:hypothetical protein
MQRRHRLYQHHLDIVVNQNAVVHDLRRSIEKRFQNTDVGRDTAHRRISWKYIWSKYGLMHAKQRMTRGDAPLQDYNIHRSGTAIQFCRRAQKSTVRSTR